MKDKDTIIWNQYKENLAKRLERKAWPEQSIPLLPAQNIHYKLATTVRKHPYSK